MEAASPAPGPRRLGIVQGGGIEAARGGHGGLHVVEPGAAPHHVASNGAVEEAGIEVVEPEAVGDALAERAFARRRGSVDGDDHGATPPSSFPPPL